jgi:hypothetical protein
MSTAAETRAWRAKNPERQQENARRYRAANIERIREYHREYRKGYYAKNKARILARAAALYALDPGHKRKTQSKSRWRRAGVDPTAAEQALAAHNGTCDCCGTESPVEARWCVDHDHATGRVRGVLCSKCNTAIGKLGDTLEGVLRAVRYLQRNQGA